MLPEIGATELLVIAAVALIVVGPKDLPMLMRKVGQFMAKLRGMAAEFRASFDEMARQSELDELRKEVEAMRRGEVFQNAADDAANAQVSHVLGDIEQSLLDSGAQFHPPMSHQYGETTMSIDPTDAMPAAEPVAAQPKPRAPRKAAAKTAAKSAPKPAAKAAPKSARTAAAAAKPKPRKTAAAPKVAAEPAAPKPRPRKAAPKAGAAS